MIPSTHWIPRERHREVVLFLHEHGLLKFDNNRDLPLKSGGKTDVYINLRNVRSDPEALAYIAELFGYPLRWLKPKRFVEIPEALSGVAGLISATFNVPYLTIRKEKKEGRATDAEVIGAYAEGEDVVVLDDVITTGGSKLTPYTMAKERGLNVRAFLVLVDRQQGWKSDFEKLGIKAPVWAGMTLHDVRRELIALNLMERAPEAAEERNPIIVAVDGRRNFEELLPILDPLRTTGCIFKVNDLVVGEGVHRLLPELAAYGRVMIDLKFHDIPNTVGNDCAHIAPYEPWAVTVHASGKAEMVLQARRDLPASTKVLAVTALTSFTPETCKEIYGRSPMGTVKKLTGIAVQGGADGFVCSPHEVGMLRKLYPRATIVVPAVRSPGKERGDQKRVDTPEKTVARGASHIVMGRQIVGNKDPLQEMRRVLGEELKIKYFEEFKPVFPTFGHIN